MSVFFITYDACRAPSEHAGFNEHSGWIDAPGLNGDASGGSQCVSPYSTDEHELRYRAYDDDGGLMAEGTTTMRKAKGDEYEGAYHADRYHMHDAGAVRCVFYDRKTGRGLGELFC